MTDRLAQLKSMLEASPNEPFILFALAQECSKRGNDADALQYYEKLVASSPDYTGAYYHLGKLQERQGRMKEAISTYNKGMEITRAKGDHHAFSELQSALSLLTDED